MNAQEQPLVALVTGASRGIGREVAHQLAHTGMTVLLTARDIEQAASVASQLSDDSLDIRPYPLD